MTAGRAQGTRRAFRHAQPWPGHRRAKYYRLTPAGRQQREAEEHDWHRVVKAMTAALESA